MGNAKTSVIKNTSYVVGFDGVQHVLYKKGEIAFCGNEIVYVGTKYSGPADVTIDAKEGLVIPGLINLHCHVAASPVEKGFFEDVSSRNFYGTELYEYMRCTQLDVEDQMNVFQFSLAEILRKGSTTIFELGLASDEMIQMIGSSGIRAYVGPMARSCVFMTKDGKTVHYEWDEPKAFDRLEETVEKFEKFDNSYDGRMKIALYPGQADCAVPDYLKEVRKAADATGMKIQIHACQSINEYQTILARYGTTPADYLTEYGIAGTDVFYGHYIVPSGHSMNSLKIGNELQTIVDTKTNVVHCPWCFGRRGLILESFAKYQEMGINMTLGTDTFPQDIIQEMKCAAVFSKIATQDTFRTTAAQVFNAATLNGAKALGRTDIGRLCKGAKADIVIVGTDNMEMSPLRDPIKALIYTGISQNIDKVIVDGILRVDQGNVLGIDFQSLRKQMQHANERMCKKVHSRDYKGRKDTEIAPMSFPVIE